MRSCYEGRRPVAGLIWMSLSEMTPRSMKGPLLMGGLLR
jgi:hypothetical protein